MTVRTLVHNKIYQISSLYTNHGGELLPQSTRRNAKKILRKGLLINSMLFNSEAWHNFSQSQKQLLKKSMKLS